MPVVVGTVETVLRFPVKSMRGERLGATRLDAAGVEGDRAWALLDGAGHWASAKTDRARWRLYDGMLDLAARTADDGAVVVTLPDGRVATPGRADADALLSAHLGAELRFDRGDGGRRWGRHHDGSPLHLVTTASLRALAADGDGAPGEAEALDPLRLRPNLVVRTPDDAGEFVENGWIGATLRVGGATLRATEPTERCVMTTRAQGDELPRDPTVLKRIGRRNRAVAGIYLDVVEAGAVAVGDEVLLLAPAAGGPAS